APPAGPPETVIAGRVPTVTPTTTAAPVPGDEQVVRTAPVHAEHGRPPQPGHARLRPQEIDAPVRTADGPVPTAITPTVPVTATEPVAPATPVTGAVEAGATRHVRPAIVEAARHLRSEGGRTSLVVRLDPPELGAVLVRLTVKDGQVDVQLRTPDLTARGDLQAQSFDVQQVLRESGLDLSSFDVAHGDVLGAPAGDPRGSQPDGGRQTPDRATPRPSWGADGTATTAVVMDDAPSPQPAGTWL
ncbi:MAG: flagellar hook-length control protein FliK, partial [Mycobacteriales bacterium]